MHVILLIIVSIGAFAQISSQTSTSDSQKSHSQQVYEIREKSLKRADKSKKILVDRNKEIKEVQERFKQKKRTATDNYQSDLKRIEAEESAAIGDVNKKFDALLKELSESTN